MTAALWTAAAAAAATGGTARGDWHATGVSIDTRSLRSGDLFVALTGPNFDGHDFAAQALAQGAAAVLVERPVPGLPADAPALQVPDAPAALAALGRVARNRAQGLQVIGVTGSVGKTSTKAMLADALAGSFRVTASERSFNNQLGVPLTLARIHPSAECAVVEMGMSGAGELLALTTLVRPDIAVVTAIAPSHIASLGSLEAIAEAKAEIFAGVPAAGTAIIPADGPGAEILHQRAQAAGIGRILRLGAGENADAALLRVCVKADSTGVHARIGAQELAYRIGAPGRHLAQNSLAALLAVQAAGGDLARACCALAHWSVPAGRGTREQIALGAGGSFLLVDDSYNANPASMQAAIDNLAAQPRGADRQGRDGRRIAFLGDMLELGADERAHHARLAEADSLRAVDLVFTCGPRMRHLHDALEEGRRGGWWSAAPALAARAPQLVQDGDVVMVKGSNGSRLHAVAAALRAISGG